MRRTLRILLCLCVGWIACLSLALGHARWRAIHPAVDDVEPDLVSPTAPNGDALAEAIVREIRIAEAKDLLDFHARFPRKWERYVVRFEITKVLKGRFAEPEVRLLVHSPSLELQVRKEGQRGVLHWYRSSRYYHFVPTEVRRLAGSSAPIVSHRTAPVH